MSAGRVRELDVLRGFALFGILLVNALLMAGPDTVFGGGTEATTVDRGAAWAVAALVTGKFYLLFSFLFGYSFVLQERSAERAGVAFAPRHLRRTAGLFALGLAHAVLLYPGDILMTYAALALVLYGLRGLTPRAAVRLAAGLVGVLAVLLFGYGLLTVAVAGPPASTRYDPLLAAYRGDALSVIGAHVRALPDALATDLLYAPDMLAAFLAGLAAGKAQLLERYGRDRARLRRTAALCLPVGLAGGVVMAVCSNGPLDSRWFYVGHAVGILTAPALTASYACGLLLLVRPRAASVLAAAGRTALTHYLSQSFVLAVVFTGYGLGLYGRLGAAAVLTACVGLYGAQLAVSVRWLGRMRQGPVELLLRAVTLGRCPIPSPAWSGSGRSGGVRRVR